MLDQVEVKLNYVDAISCLTPNTKFNCTLFGSLRVNLLGRQFLITPSLWEFHARHANKKYGAWCGIRTVYASGLCVSALKCAATGIGFKMLLHLFSKTVNVGIT